MAAHVIAEEFSSFADASRRIGHPDHPGDAFPREADWGISGVPGLGLPGGSGGGWMVTYARDFGDDDVDGWLIARALGTDHDRAGHYIVLAGPLTTAQDSALLEESHQRPGPRTYGPVTIEGLIEWLRESL